MTTFYVFGQWIQQSATSSTVVNPFAQWYDSDVASPATAGKSIILGGGVI